MAGSLSEPMKDVFTSSRLMILDFKEIPDGLAEEENIRLFFENAEARGINPRLPENRQRFNNRMLGHVSMRYLFSRYAEDRIAMLAGSQIADEGRTLHLGVDVFSSSLEQIYAPCDGKVVRADYEQQSHGYGHYILFTPDDTAKIDGHLFFGHLSRNLPRVGEEIEAGQPMAQLGDYVNEENGGWSRHLHLQLTRDLPPQGETPIGYSTVADIAKNKILFPDPMTYFPEWQIVS